MKFGQFEKSWKMIQKIWLMSRIDLPASLLHDNKFNCLIVFTFWNTG